MLHFITLVVAQPSEGFNICQKETSANKASAGKEKSDKVDSKPLVENII